MVSLTQNANGAYRARKRLPDDVREEYGRLYGPSVEAKFFAPASTTAHDAKQLFREWEAEVQGWIATIRAQRNGDGVSLTPRQVRALAGEWYDWFITPWPRSRCFAPRSSDPGALSQPRAITNGRAHLTESSPGITRRGMAPLRAGQCEALISIRAVFPPAQPS